MAAGRPNAFVAPVAMPSAMARTTYSATSSTTATPSTMRANAVSRMPRSYMIRVITGMLVMAIAVANTRTKDTEVADGPQKSCSWMSARKPRPARNGRTMPVTVIQATGRASSRLKADRISAPAQNSRRSSPSCETALG